jgi:hypothetical protein
VHFRQSLLTASQEHAWQHGRATPDIGDDGAPAQPGQLLQPMITQSNRDRIVGFEIDGASVATRP